jgi:hypothetical protein
MPKSRPKKRASPKQKSPKRASPKRASPKRKSPKRASPKQKSPKRKSPKRKSPKRKSPKRASPKQKSPKRKSPKKVSPKRKVKAQVRPSTVPVVVVKPQPVVPQPLKPLHPVLGIPQPVVAKPQPVVAKPQPVRPPTAPVVVPQAPKPLHPVVAKPPSPPKSVKGKRGKRGSKVPDDTKLIELANTKRWNFIRGPVTLTEHYSAKYNKNVYVFGDIHVTNAKCPKHSNRNNTIDFTSLLGSLPYLKNPDGTFKTIDYFLEIGYRSKLFPKKGSDYYKGYWQELFNVYKNCLQVEKDVCQYKNVRFHYSDIRHIPLLQNVMNYIWYLEDLESDNLKGAKHRYNDIKWDQLQRVAMDVNKYLEDVKITGKINKQYNKLQYPEVQKQLENSLEKDILNELRVLTPEFVKSTRDVVDKNMKKIDTITRSQVSINLRLILDGMSRLMDLYLIARMFRKFKKIEGKPSEPPTNIIIYAGDFHAKNYRRFLDRLGFSSKSTASMKLNADYQCIDVSKFVQPFFSEHNLQPLKVYDTGAAGMVEQIIKPIVAPVKKILGIKDDYSYSVRSFDALVDVKNAGERCMRLFDHDFLKNIDKNLKGIVETINVSTAGCNFYKISVVIPYNRSEGLSNKDVIERLFKDLTKEVKTEKRTVTFELDEYKSSEEKLKYYVPISNIIVRNVEFTNKIESALEGSSLDVDNVMRQLMSYKPISGNWYIMRDPNDEFIGDLQQEYNETEDPEVLEIIDNIEKQQKIIKSNPNRSILFYGDNDEINDSQDSWNRQISAYIYDAINPVGLRVSAYNALLKGIGEQTIKPSYAIKFT